MRETEEDFRKYTIQDLFDEIIRLEQGDGWDGMSTRAQVIETKCAENVFGEKMRELGVEWV